jgi:formylglycine-generating enzyme required for sulfatase activity
MNRISKTSSLMILIFSVASFSQAFAQNENRVLIPAGEFQMGSKAAEDETPHTIHLSAYTIDKFEVTQEQFEKVLGNNPSDFFGKSLPVEQVTWYEARDYCKAVGKRLPTEAEWEKAARAGTGTIYTWGDAINGDYAWYWDNSKRSTHSVGTRKPNAFGLYDMSGNVWEWVADYYEDTYYQTSPKENPKGPFTSKYRVIRGGSWRDLSEFLRTTRRNYDLPAGRFNHIGFRCAQSVK